MAPTARVAGIITGVSKRTPSRAPLYDHRFRGGRESSLLAYGPVLNDISKRTGSYVSKILNEAKAANLPVEQPPDFILCSR
jgi:hypothetical protein